MKKLFVLLIVALCINFNAQSQLVNFIMEPEYSGSAIAKIIMLEEEFDFGEIEKGVPVSHTFEFINDGDAPLLISNVKTSCGCTASDYTKEAILPGRKGEVVATYNASKEGAFNKSLNLQSNGGEKVLYIKGHVK